ncbi:MAG: 23S rRNA (pseudouridine(1915)-N(3))-methyltransferase RlmH [Ruminococcaceae bacterium]|nr:23S rRNA (pseudouridine(1915)-N(3))-methyltransferase RlmH [Oscillospiraceae bacterium]
MSKIKLIVMGQLTDRYYREAADEYIKRMSRSSPVTEVELKCVRLSDDPSEKEIASALAKEAEMILAEIPKRALVVAMCIEGKHLSSEELAERISQAEMQGYSELCFIIGSSYGLDEKVKSGAHLRLSMSKMTFPHKLARVMLLEQLYRASEITQNKKYHK